MPDAQFHDIVERFGELIGCVLGGRRGAIAADQQEAAADAVAAAHRFIEEPRSCTGNDGAAVIVDAESGQPPDEGVLKRRPTRHRRDQRVAQSLRGLVRCSHGLGQEIRGLDDRLDHRPPLGGVTVEQRFGGVTAHGQIELPDQIPDILQSGVHPLSAEGTMNVCRVAGQKNPADAQLRRLPMMDAEIAAPVQGGSLQSGGCAFRENSPHKIQRRRVALRAGHDGDDAPARGAHRKYRQRTGFIRAQQQFVRGQIRAGLDVGQHERCVVGAAFEGEDSANAGRGCARHRSRPRKTP